MAFALCAPSINTSLSGFKSVVFKHKIPMLAVFLLASPPVFGDQIPVSALHRFQKNDDGLVLLLIWFSSASLGTSAGKRFVI